MNYRDATSATVYVTPNVPPQCFGCTYNGLQHQPWASTEPLPCWSCSRINEPLKDNYQAKIYGVVKTKYASFPGVPDIGQEWA